MWKVAALACAFALSGCAGSPIGDALAGPEGLAKRDDAYCQSIGALPGTEAYITCRTAASLERSNRHAAAFDASANALAAGAVINSANNRPALNQPMPSILPQQVRCRSTPIGNTLQTVCQ